LDPSIALKLLGYETSVEVGLGQYETPRGMIEVAGSIDSTSRTVRISGQYPVAVQTFTTAHELGHAVLHPASSGVHRDRPLDGSTVSRDRREMEADTFATLFLMPEKLVRSRFVDMFGPAPFSVNEQTGYALFGDLFAEALPKLSTRRELSRQLSGAKHYNGRQITSLADLFHVSVAAMAIRLEELNLVVAPGQN
jgi:Zn-dependent peptidase ImmA (M78 family)